MERQIIYKTSFKSYLKVLFIFIVFILACSFSFFFYIKEDIAKESVNDVVTSTEKQAGSLKNI